MSFQALDNGFRSVEDAEALGGICGTPWYRDVERFSERRQAVLPCPLSGEVLERGYGYRLSVRHLELSDMRCSSAQRRRASGLS